jgi:RNA polymerase sigma factor (sigma-70 family)
MATAVLLGNVVRRLRSAPVLSDGAELSDARLLERFVGQHDSSAFAVLLRRHGPMVLAVCRQVLGQAQDVEDAFQAAFLVLVRRAATVRKYESLASWLYGVALRTARQARRDMSRRLLRERRAAVDPVQTPHDDLTWSEVRAVLYEEIERLPERYRAPLVLCYLEGQTNSRAARQLGVPVGSLSKRLGRARGLLRGRLLRRGVGIPAAALLVLPAGQGGAAVPPALAEATTRAAGDAVQGVATAGTATALADGVTRALVASKAKSALGWLLALGMVVAGGWLATGRGDAGPARTEAVEQPVPTPEPPAPPPEARPDSKPRSVIDTRRYLALRNGGSEHTEAAVAAGLRWLADQQKDDGRWVLDGTMINHTAATAFGLLPFLAAGQVHVGPLARAPYDLRIQKGLDWLLTQQKNDGDLGGGAYGHALATTALCHAYALTHDVKLKAPAEKAVAYIIMAQNAAGAWGYTPGAARGDTSVTSSQVSALYAARQAGLAVPPKTMEAAHAYLDTCQAPGGGYGYVTPIATPTMTAAGLLSRLNLGWAPHQAAFRDGLSELAKSPPGSGRGVYHDYWATQVYFRAGGEEWVKRNAQVHKFLLDKQDQGNDPARPQLKGSWPPSLDPNGAAGGRLLVTSLALLTMEVYYRDELPFALAPNRELTKDDVTRNWTDLAAADEVTARRAVWSLARSPEKSLPLLREQLPPRPPPGLDQARVARLVADLDNDDFEKREQASAALEKMGPSVEVLLRDARARSKSAEARRRLADLLAKIDAPRGVPEPVRLARAIELLEYAGTPEAVRLLRELAAKDPDTDLARAAKAALERLKAR